eukprot:2988899-Pleurochrysis_carterae.AAC.1
MLSLIARTLFASLSATRLSARPIGGWQRAIEAIELLIILVERAQRWLLDALDFERSHHGLDRSGDRVRRSIRFGHQNVD